MSSRDYKSSGPKIPPEGKYPPASRLYVGNLDTTVVSKKDVKKMFEKYGRLQEDIRLHKGFCFIQFDNPEAAEAAIQNENGKQIGSKLMEVEYAHGRKPKDGIKEAKAIGSKRSGNFRDEQYDDYDSGHYNHQSKQRRKDLPPRNNNRSYNDNQPSQNARITVPIFVMSPVVTDYAYYVRDIMRNALGRLGIEPVVRQEEDVLQSLNRALKDGDRYTILINKKHESIQLVSFKAVNKDGTSPGFADTKLDDVINYIIKQESIVVQPQQSQQQVAPPQMIPQQQQASYAAVPQQQGLYSVAPSAQQVVSAHYMHGAAVAAAAPIVPVQQPYGAAVPAYTADVHHQQHTAHLHYQPQPQHLSYNQQQQYAANAASVHTSYVPSVAPTAAANPAVGLVAAAVQPAQTNNYAAVQQQPAVSSMHAPAYDPAAYVGAAQQQQYYSVPVQQQQQQYSAAPKYAPAYTGNVLLPQSQQQVAAPNTLNGVDVQQMLALLSNMPLSAQQQEQLQQQQQAVQQHQQQQQAQQQQQQYYNPENPSSNYVPPASVATEKQNDNGQASSTAAPSSSISSLLNSLSSLVRNN